ncbi:MAG: hypothetical protein ABSG24_08360 [Acidimicrobiales bacterium]|jgi:hypothetical protein
MSDERRDAVPEEEMGGDSACLLGLFCEDCGVEVGVADHLPECRADERGPRP